MAYLVGGFMTKSYEERRRMIVQIAPAAWRFFCQGECATEMIIHAVSLEDMKKKVERYGFRPSGESFICEKCLLALQVENIRGR